MALPSARTERARDPSGRRAPGAVAIIGSAGAIEAGAQLLGALQPDFPAPFFIAQHLDARSPSVLPAILMHRTRFPAKWAEPGEKARPGVLYVVPAGYSLEVGPDGFALSRLAAEPCSWLKSPDLLLLSVADYYGSGAVGIVLSGALPAGILGLRAIQRAGGITMAQSEASAFAFTMPQGAIDVGKVDIVLSPARIAEALRAVADTWQSNQPRQTPRRSLRLRATVEMP